MGKVIIDGYITNEWARRLFNHGQTLKVMGGLAGIPKSCEIHSGKSEEYCQPIRIQTIYKGQEPYNPGLEFIRGGESDKG